MLISWQFTQSYLQFQTRKRGEKFPTLGTKVMFLLLTYNMDKPTKGYFEICYSDRDLISLTRTEYNSDIEHEVSNWVYQSHDKGEMFKYNNIPVVIVLNSYVVKEGEFHVYCDEP